MACGLEEGCGGVNSSVSSGIVSAVSGVEEELWPGRTARLQFRAEGFNITNTPLFGMPNTTIAGFDSNGVPTQAGNFAKITTTNAFYTPRDIQFALKLIF